ncbi:hypothetical protein [Lutispora thermophila]|uniref:ABC-2 family transporter protein n=1 Tax=Lutispora thermophila DSM 19022 TaxID=1122184 RepID=A0A1M6CYY1_9FIRM|nr:hypothetical protein [Lutispora thermophila]SHI66232.1 hypothetical protein SAMN02745176_00931 [Lutispora thermophila DSM 19022]
MRNNLKKELKSVFDVPPPTRKNQFLSQLNYPKTSRMDFIISQLGYIRKRTWILSMLLFIGILDGLYFYKVSNSFIWVVSSILPFISLSSISEIVKSTTYNMKELEMSCKYNFLQICLVRLGVLGATNFMLLIGILILFVGKTDYSFIRLGLYITTPYLLNCYGSLYVINRLKTRMIMYVCCGVTAFVSVLNTLLTIQINEIYTEMYWLFWPMSFIILLLLSAREIVKLIRKMEELQWNLSLTA